MSSDGVRLECPPEVAELVDLAMARDWGIFPLACADGTLTLAVAAPLSAETRHRLGVLFNREIVEEVHPRSAILKAISRQLRGYVPKEGESHNSLSWVWPGWSGVLADGTLRIKASGWDNRGHWSGAKIGRAHV